MKVCERTLSDISVRKMKHNWNIVISANVCPHALAHSTGRRDCLITHEKCTRENCPVLHQHPHIL